MSTNHSKQWKPNITINNIKLKSFYLKNIRNFFYERELIEVDTPLLYQFAVSDPFLENFSVSTHSGERFLQTSPEYAMKRLLAIGIGSIFQICKATRNEQCGNRHSFEFLMLEWYRVGYTYKELMTEVEHLFRLFRPGLKATYYSYLDIFQKYVGINPHDIEIHKLISKCTELFGHVAGNNLKKDDYLNLLMTHVIEPQLINSNLVFVYDYPMSQSALAKTSKIGDYTVAQRFEAYYNGIEIANGYDELTDHIIQKERFQNDIQTRVENNIPTVDIDYKLINALEQGGIPQCSGVAIGIERFIMAIENIDDINTLLF